MTEEQLIQLIENNGLEKYRNDILRFTRNTIFVKLQRVDNENEISIGHSKMGGNPDLPSDFQWYSYGDLPLTFIGQFRLSDLTAYDINHDLPQNGILYFFYEAAELPLTYEGFHKGGHRVLYLPDEKIPLARYIHPTKVSKTIPIAAQPACQVSISRGVTFPHHTEAREFLLPKLSEQEEAQYWDMLRGMRSRFNHYLLGTPDEVQGDMRATCQLESSNLKWESSSEEQRNTAIQLARDWQLLLQVDSDETNLNIMWVDLGLLYFWIRKQDLQNKNFNDTWAMVEFC
jgi:uncharacterized protein YwqG